MRVDRALRAARADRRTAVVPYLLVDRSRRRAVRTIVSTLRDGGATALELGFPFSDPIADGPVLAAAHARALAHGTRWEDLLAAARAASPVLPTAVMTYANPLAHRGPDRALAALAAAGVTGLIVPDLSLEESAGFRAAARRHRISLVLLVAPGTPDARIDRAARAARGFLYLVGHYGTTGGAARGSTVDLRPLVARARGAAPHLPVLVGFGIRDGATAASALASGADGVVVGTALEERLRRGASLISLAGWLRTISSVRPPR